jgi:hypothetical protein
MKINAILIDPIRQVVEPIEMDNSLKGFYQAIHCKNIASYGRLANGDVATGDDHALLQGPTPLFWFGKYPLPLAGRVVITSVDEEGDCINARSSVETVRALIRFVPEIQNEALFIEFHAHLC